VLLTLKKHRSDLLSFMAKFVWRRKHLDGETQMGLSLDVLIQQSLETFCRSCMQVYVEDIFQTGPLLMRPCELGIISPQYLQISMPMSVHVVLARDSKKSRDCLPCPLIWL
jgi:hypothetical protein